MFDSAGTVLNEVQPKNRRCLPNIRLNPGKTSRVLLTRDIFGAIVVDQECHECLSRWGSIRVDEGVGDSMRTTGNGRGDQQGINEVPTSIR